MMIRTGLDSPSGGAASSRRRLSVGMLSSSPPVNVSARPGSAGSPRRRSSSTSSTSSTGRRKSQGDRFIPNRSLLDLAVARFNLLDFEEEDLENLPQSPTIQNYRNKMRATLLGDSQHGGVLPVRVSPQRRSQTFTAERHVLSVLERDHVPPAVRATKSIRTVPQTPDRILDAPELRCDFYLNLLDWSVRNFIAVALGETVYLWNAVNGVISTLYQNDDPSSYISSLSYSRDGRHLAIGNSANKVQIWDVAAGRKLRVIHSADTRVAALAWGDGGTISTGSREGSIFNHDVRAARHHTATLVGHNQEICGLKWSPDSKFLASGGNDNRVNIWDAAGGQVHRFTEHRAAVKAIAWCPWQSNLLATGGGTACKTIRFWNSARGTCVGSIDTNSQISSVIWNSEHREIISGHGFSENQLSIWRYPTKEKVTDLKGHQERVLSMAMNPEGTTVVSAGCDETLRFWNCFAKDEKRRRKERLSSGSRSRLHETLR